MSQNQIDREVIEQLDPNRIVSYLQHSGWESQYASPRFGSGWIRQVGHAESVGVAVPRENSFADFAPCMLDLIETLSRVEGRTKPEILADLERDPVVNSPESQGDASVAAQHS